MDIAVRPATVADARQLAELRLEWSRLAQQPSRRDVDAYTSHLADWMTGLGDRLIVRVADADGSLVGMAWMVVVERVPNFDNRRRLDGDLQSVYVTAAYRKRGVGRSLIQSMCDYADEIGIARIVVAANQASRPTYSGVGFEASALLLQRLAPESSR